MPNDNSQTQSTNTYPTPLPQGPTQPHRRRAWPWILGLALVLILGIGATTGVASGFGHRGHADLSDDEVTEHIDHVTSFVLDELDATAEQRVEIEAIIDRAVPDLLAFRAEGDSLRQEIHDALQEEPIDRERVEALRADLVDLVDRASLALTNGLLDIQAELTPDQRAEIREHADRRHRSHSR